jgi:NAD(P)H-quinone oxidoreductase subunit 4
MLYGYKLFHTPKSDFVNSGPRELLVSISIFLPVIAIGIYPDFVFSLSAEKVQAIVPNSFHKDKES